MGGGGGVDEGDGGGGDGDGGDGGGGVGGGGVGGGEGGGGEGEQHDGTMCTNGSLHCPVPPYDAGMHSGRAGLLQNAGIGVLPRMAL